MKDVYSMALLATATLFGTGCMVGPKYVKPAFTSPPAFKEALPPNATNTSHWKVANPNDQAERGKWWVIFGDTQLNDLEDQLTQANRLSARVYAVTVSRRSSSCKSALRNP